MSVLASRGILTLAGGIVSGLLSFAAVLVVTHGLGASTTGQFFEGVSLFNIASNVLVLGADVALLRFVSGEHAAGRFDTRHVFVVALVPIVVVACIASVVGFALVPRLSAALNDHGSPAELTLYLRALILALPFAAAYLACVSTTRAFGTVKPFVVVDKMLKPLLQVVLLLVVVLAGFGAAAMAGAWVAPIALGLVVTVWWLRSRIPRTGGVAAFRGRDEMVPLATSFWRFSLPRGFAGVFQVLILWLDTLLIGLYRPSSDVAVYTASSRYVLLVTFVGIAITQALAPQIGDLLARRARARAETVFRTATVWNVAVTWPLLLMLVMFAPAVLVVFGHEYQQGAVVVRILAASMLIGSGVGPVDWVLLMEGKSSWNLLNTAVALALNIGLNVLLIPRFGIAGAAIAWGVSIVVNNVAPLVEVLLFVRMSPFSRIHLRVSAAAVGCFVLPALVIGSVFGFASLAALVLSSLLGGAAYLYLLSRWRDEVQVAELAGALRRRRASDAPAPAGTSST